MTKEAYIRIRRDDDDAILDEAAASFKKVWRTGKAGSAVFTFSSPSQLFSTITPKRWELIERLQAIGASSIRGLARALDRDVKRVHEDVVALIDWGLVARTESGQVRVPFDVIHADFDLRAVA